ncbi:MAG TPA: hypothetical protein PLV92_09330, partial [Pirellulaceae bacterium]|nr:hypothetical protein [Pirellulaceae bacterium]
MPLSAALSPATARADEPSREAFRRATAWRESVGRGSVINSQVNLQWLPGGLHAWLKRELPDREVEYRLIDVQAGKNESAFDHERLADALRKAGARDADAKRLNVELMSLAADGGSWELRGYGKRWRLDRASHELTELTGGGAPGGAAPGGGVGGPLDPLPVVPRG